MVKVQITVSFVLPLLTRMMMNLEHEKQVQLKLGYTDDNLYFL